MTVSWDMFRGRSGLILGLGILGVLAMSLWLWPFWTNSPELSHAFLAPILSLYLFRRSAGEASLELAPKLRSALLLVLGSLGAFITLTTAFSALAQGLLHSQPVFIGVHGFVLFLLLCTLVLELEEPPLARLNGTSLCAMALWLFSMPIPPGPLERLTHVLRDMSSEVVVNSLVWIGIPAERQGNILSFSAHFVGVEDACSGIRSLMACLFSATMLGGLLLRGYWRRLVLIVFGGLLALGGNYLRSIILCLLVHRDVEIHGFWHDATAYAVLLGSVVILYFACWFLGQGRQDSSSEIIPRPKDEKTPLSWMPVANYACWVAAAAFVFIMTRTTPTMEREKPDLRALLSLDVPGWSQVANPQVSQFAESLQTDTLFETSYYRPGMHVTLYMSYWAAGQSTLGLVGLHRPDVCLPSSGWVERPLPAPLPSYPLGEVQRYCYDFRGQTHYMWFWHFFGGHVVERLPGFYPWQLGPYILKRRNSARAPQWVIRVSSNLPLEALMKEPLLLQFFERLKKEGFAEQAP